MRVPECQKLVSDNKTRVDTFLLNFVRKVFYYVRNRKKN